MDKYPSIDDMPINKLYLIVDLSIRRHFELNTELVLHSDEEHFYVNLKRLFSIFQKELKMINRSVF